MASGECTDAENTSPENGAITVGFRSDLEVTSSPVALPSEKLRKVAKPGVEKQSIEEIFDLPTMIAVPKWPMDYGPIDNTRRAKVSGPGSNLKETASVDLFNSGFEWEELITGNFGLSGQTQVHTFFPSDREDSFSNLLVGAGNKLYFSMDYPSPGATFAYRIPTGQLWQTLYASTGTALDNKGHLIYSSESIFIVSSYGKWSHFAVMPEYPAYGRGFGSYYYADVGYHSMYDWQADVELRAYNSQGVEVWVNDHILGKVDALAEDSDRFVYVRDHGEGLRKISPTGETIWDIKMPSAKYSLNYDKHMLGPIPGPDGRIWTSTKIWGDEGLVTIPGATPGSGKKSTEMKRGPVFVVVNADGTIYKYGKYANRSMPRIACLGGNGVLYIAFEDGTVAGYQDWDQLVGEWQTPAENGIHDMIMDKDNWIYIAYTAYGLLDLGKATYLSVLHPLKGESKKTFKIEVPSEWVDSDVELAIGEDGKLFYLHSAGYLKEYSPGAKLKAGVFEGRVK